MTQHCAFSFFRRLGIIEEVKVEVWRMFLAEATQHAVRLLGMSGKFWVIMIVMALFLTAILTSSYNEDKTKGL
jgi:hypothetical protein